MNPTPSASEATAPGREVHGIRCYPLRPRDFGEIEQRMRMAVRREYAALLAGVRPGGPEQRALLAQARSEIQGIRVTDPQTLLDLATTYNGLQAVVEVGTRGALAGAAFEDAYEADPDTIVDVLQGIVFETVPEMDPTRAATATPEAPAGAAAATGG